MEDSFASNVGQEAMENEESAEASPETLPGANAMITEDDGNATGKTRSGISEDNVGQGSQHFPAWNRMHSLEIESSA